MKFPYSLPNIGVIQGVNVIFEITTVREFDERDDIVYLKCAEYVKEFKRGFTCDFQLEYLVQDQVEDNKETVYDNIKDLVLVHINKRFNLDGIPEFEYVFYK